jgi:hypothetical protein
MTTKKGEIMRRQRRNDELMEREKGEVCNVARGHNFKHWKKGVTRQVLACATDHTVGQERERLFLCLLVFACLALPFFVFACVFLSVRLCISRRVKV